MTEEWRMDGLREDKGKPLVFIWASTRLQNKVMPGMKGVNKVL